MEPTPGGNGGTHGVPPSSQPIPLAVNLTEQWRRYLAAQQRQTATVVDLDLPSGMRVRATRPSLLSLLAAKRIPDALAGPVEELIALGTVAADGVGAELARRQAAAPVEFAATFLAILDTVWLAAVVEPRFAADGDATDAEAIAVGAVGIDDKTYLFVWAQGVDQSVAEFLDRAPRPGPALGTAPDGGDVRPGPGDVGRDRPAG